MEEKRYAYQPAEAQEDSKELNLLELGRLLLSKWYLLIIAGIVAAAAAFCIGHFFMSPKYETSITLNVDNARVENGSGNTSSSDVAAARLLAETYRILLSSNSLMEEMVRCLAEEGVNMTEGALSACIRVTVVNDTQILRVTVETGSSELSYQIASAYEKVAPEMIVKLSNRGKIYIVDHARMATQPSSPNLTQSTTMAFFLGLVLCAAVLLLRKFIDRRVYSPEDIEQELHLSVIGQIPVSGLETEQGVQYHAVRIGEMQHENI